MHTGPLAALVDSRPPQLLNPHLTRLKSTPTTFQPQGALAEKCHAFAKALHYKEMEFCTSPATAIEALIHINNQLRQPEAAVGVLTYAQKHLNMVRCRTGCKLWELSRLHGCKLVTAGARQKRHGFGFTWTRPDFNSATHAS